MIKSKVKVKQIVLLKVIYQNNHYIPSRVVVRSGVLQLSLIPAGPCHQLWLPCMQLERRARTTAPIETLLWLLFCCKWFNRSARNVTISWRVKLEQLIKYVWKALISYSFPFKQIYNSYFDSIEKQEVQKEVVVLTRPRARADSKKNIRKSTSGVHFRKNMPYFRCKLDYLAIWTGQNKVLLTDYLKI